MEYRILANQKIASVFSRRVEHFVVKDGTIVACDEATRGRPESNNHHEMIGRFLNYVAATPDAGRRPSVGAGNRASRRKRNRPQESGRLPPAAPVIFAENKLVENKKRAGILAQAHS